jgi:hypothetical protein
MGGLQSGGKTMCSYCHEFIKRNQPACGYCGKVFPKKEEPTIVEVVCAHDPKIWRSVAAVVLASLAMGLVVFGAVDFFLLKPALLETVEISEPADIELVELEPSPYAFQH